MRHEPEVSICPSGAAQPSCIQVDSVSFSLAACPIPECQVIFLSAGAVVDSSWPWSWMWTPLRFLHPDKSRVIIRLEPQSGSGLPSQFPGKLDWILSSGEKVMATSSKEEEEEEEGGVKASQWPIKPAALQRLNRIIDDWCLESKNHFAALREDVNNQSILLTHQQPLFRLLTVTLMFLSQSAWSRF